MDEAVGAVAVYQAAYGNSSFPGKNPTDELIGLRALSRHPKCWDHADRSVHQYLEVATKIEIVNEQSVALQIDIGL